ncbi:retrovirus-related Pol polyprotein from transposon opus [Nephila pilipes]|uniref:Retrovirus-related Pol polyprotein from transposon opus n=1 Tax=Nephila pilipes TaxID=299642 RepID=A0A8X6UGW0_NEPPI|nr:retrovirus-related Pol polyprotein from transposon opus [Nephila pilipes]
MEAITEINCDAIAEEQVKDEELKQLMKNNSSLKFKLSTLPSGKTLWCDISTSKIRPYISQKFRLQMFQLIHGFAHPGVTSTIKMMTERHVWSNMKKKKKKVRENGTRHALDAKSAKLLEGLMYCLTRIDRFSCWIEVVPLPDITAEIVGMAFYEHWISSVQLVLFKSLQTSIRSFCNI